MLFDAILRGCRFFDRCVRYVGLAGGWLILPLIAIIMFDVVTRKLDVTRLWFAEFTIHYGYSISTIIQDLEWHVHAVLMMLSFGLAYLMNAHVRVDVFRELLHRRKQAWLEWLGLLLLGIPFLLVMVVYGWVLFDIAWVQNEGSDSLTGLNHRWFVKFFIPFGFVLALCALLVTLGRLTVYLFGSPAQKSSAQESLSVFSHDVTGAETASPPADPVMNAGKTDRISQGH